MFCNANIEKNENNLQENKRIFYKINEYLIYIKETQCETAKY